MKVDGGNGKMYTRDHPHEIISPYVMRFEEIRDTIRMLLQNPETGWCRAGLERALGLNKTRITRLLTVGWIWPKEQVRLTHRLREILEGRIVPQLVGRKQEGVYVDPSRPVVIPKRIDPRIVRGHVTLNGLTLHPRVESRPPPLPEFRSIFRDVPEWEPPSVKNKKRRL
jgi:hypothetical protein